MERETKITYPDYKAIQKESHRIDCTISEADFYTNHPNLNRINTTASDINRYLKYKRGGRI